MFFFMHAQLKQQDFMMGKSVIKNKINYYEIFYRVFVCAENGGGFPALGQAGSHDHSRVRCPHPIGSLNR